MQEQQYKKKSVIGIRLSYLSKIPAVRAAIQDEMQSHELVDIMRHLRVGSVEFNVRDDEKEDFAAKLDQLSPELGLANKYKGEPEVRHDKQNKRAHDWDWWEEKIRASQDLRDQLNAAVERVLGYEKEVDAYGHYKSPQTVVLEYDSGSPSPELDFWTTEPYSADPLTEKGLGGPER